MKTEITKMLQQAVEIHGHTLDADGKRVDAQKARTEFLTALASAEPDEKAQVEFIKKAWGRDGKGNTDEMVALNALRVLQVQNYMSADSQWASSFFSQETLGPSDEPVYTNETMEEVRIGHLGEGGTPDTVRLVKTQSKTTVGLRILSSQKVRYLVNDLYKGNIGDMARKTIDIARDLRIQKDKEHYTVLTQTVANGGAFGVFSYEQGRSNRSTRIYVPHSSIATGRLPTTNDIDLTAAANTANNPMSYGGLTAFDPQKVILAIMNYAAQWGKNLPGGGMLIPTGDIIMPSNEIISVATSNFLTANSNTSSIQMQVADNGYTSLMYGGKKWNFIPDASYCPAGYCFPLFNLQPGISYSKPSFDKEFVETDLRTGWETRDQLTAYGAVVISQYRPRALRIRYA